jgi:UDP-2,3-diacylglucosamine pyrophosphatase LpxH
MQENNVSLSIHGHVHNYYFGKVYNDNVSYLTVPWLKKPTYCIVNVYNKSFNIKLIEL